MKFLALAVMLLVIGVTAVPDANARDAKSLSVQQMKQKSSPRQAMNLHQRAQKKKVSKSQLKSMEKSANRTRTQVRRTQPTRSADQQWASLITPINRCTDLVRKVCGVNKECGSSGSCAVTIQLLDLYNAESNASEKYEIEGSCIATLSDNTVFPACQ